ncbi:winged helix-turn-helix domain-containing protein [Streptomyces parvus]|uniref:winged helix-turn-helix domain-containing protein n=1 Tax=Streptomyces parvus TaxID=66428 RepID=UPI00344C44A2
MPQASPRGTYSVIAKNLHAAIEAGEIKGTLPSEATLMASHGVSRNTIRRALKLLQNEGIVHPAPGIGWHVSEGSDRRSLLERLIAVISEDSLAVGDPYPSEARLCERFDTSRTAVRRAIAQMEGRGLLSTVHGKGRTVRSLPVPLEQP